MFRKIVLAITLLLLSTLTSVTLADTALATNFTYQGYLTNANGPVNGSCDFQFLLYNSVTGGTQIGSTQSLPDVSVTNGMFNVVLDFGSGAFDGNDRYLQIYVACPPGTAATPLIPRQPITPTPYAQFTENAPWSGILGVPSNLSQLATLTCSNGQIPKWNGTAWVCAGDNTAPSGNFWLLNGNAGTTPGTNFIGTTDNQALEFRVNNARVLRMEPNATSPNVIAGYSGNSVSAGVYGATIGGGGVLNGINEITANYGIVSGGIHNTVSGPSATVSGGEGNSASYFFATVSGGYGNTASGPSTTVGGGYGNNASNRDATVSGGENNAASGDTATVSGGNSNAASGPIATVSGGNKNTASGYDTTVSGGEHNTASGYIATVSGGKDNSASDSGATVGGGNRNTASGPSATVSGGNVNTASGAAATVGGGSNNLALAQFATIGGGGPSDVNNSDTTNNVVSDNYGTIGGGGNNKAGDANGVLDDKPYPTISGGKSNTASNEYTTVGGGIGNTASGPSATVAGGKDNAATSQYAIVGGGIQNSASGDTATVSGGFNNTASSYVASVGGGSSNSATNQFSTVGGGYQNTASGYYTTVGGGTTNTTSGDYATIPGGFANNASGAFSFAAGVRANAAHGGSFVWGDSTDQAVSSTGVNQFIVRASGGIWFGNNSLPSFPGFLNTSTGAYLSTGGVWTDNSDRNLKSNFTSVDPQVILTKVAALPVSSWNYNAQDPSIRHIGPMAQDFYASFGVGEDDKHISAVDGQGVALAAIQGLYQQVQEKDARIAALESENQTLKTKLNDIDARLAKLEAQAASGSPNAGGGLGLVLFVLGGGALAWHIKRKE